MEENVGIDAIELLSQVTKQYLTSGDFNGYGARLLLGKQNTAVVCDLIRSRKIDLVRGDGHPNPHIKAFDAETVEVQISKIHESGLEGCLYPTPEHLFEIKAGDEETAPFTEEMMRGTPQLTFRTFDLRALEWYRNDPRFEFKVDDIHGRILQIEGTQIEGRRVISDGLEFLEFGFAYDDEMNRAIAVFVRYLHDLPSEQQQEMKRNELKGTYRLHPDFYRTQILGKFPERPSIYDAFLEEKQHINAICNLIGRPNLFRTILREDTRPLGFGILLRPTKKEFRDFALQLDQLLGDDLNPSFFDGLIERFNYLTDSTGKAVKQPKGTISLLEEWIEAKFRTKDKQPLEEMFRNFRAVRRERMKPAHIIEDNVFDQKFISDQRELISMAYDAVHTLRMLLENHPAATSYRVPDHIRDAKVWTY